MSGYWGNDGSSRTGIRRGMRAARERDRRLTMRHRWYAGGIATLLSGALIFAGMSPALAEETPAPTPSATTESTDSGDAGTDAATPTPPSDEATTPDQTTPPAEQPPAEQPPAEQPPAEQPPATDTPAPSPSETAPEDTQQQSRLAAPDANLVAPLALIADCTSNCSNLTVRVNVVNTGG